MDTSLGKLDRLFDVSWHVMSETTDAGLLQRIVDAARELTDARFAVVGHDYRDGHFRLGALSVAPELVEELPSAARPPACPTPAVGGAHLDLIRESGSLRLTDDELRQHAGGPFLFDPPLPLRGLVGARLQRSDGETCGVLLVSDRCQGEFTSLDEALIVQLSTLASVYLAHLEKSAEALEREHEAQEEARQLEERLRSRSVRVAHLEERQRLARELHDSVSQSLYAISLGAHSAQRFAGTDPARAAAALDFVVEQSRAAVSDMRSLVFELRPEALETEGLHVALTRLAETAETRWELQVDLDIRCEPPGSVEIKEALYRIGQEALRNTARHARAGQATLALWCTADTMILEETDNGIGFDPRLQELGHTGLKQMCLQAERLGGSCEIDSTPGAGARVRAEIPFRSLL